MVVNKRLLSGVFTFVFAAGTTLNSGGGAFAVAATTKAAVSSTTTKTAVAAVSLNPVAGNLKTSYKPGEVIDLRLTTTGTTSTVQYKVVVINDKTKKSTDLTKGYTVKYYNPKQAYQVKFTFKEAGSYTVQITSKLSGSASRPSKTITKKVTIAQPLQIDSIVMKDETIVKGTQHFLPSTVSAKLSNGTTKELGVTWDKKSVDTNVLGVQTLNGTVKDYSKKVIFKVTVVDDMVVSVESISLTTDEGVDFKLPEKVMADFYTGVKKEALVKWDRDADTSRSGTSTYTGSIDGFDGNVDLTLNVNAVDLSLSSVTASNLREIVLSFNKSVDIKTIKGSNIRLYNGVNLVSADVMPLKDGKTVTLTAPKTSNFDNGGRYTVVVENVKDLGGKILPKVTKEITVSDMWLPAVMAANPAGFDTFTIEFSEPIKEIGTGTVEVKSRTESIGVIPIFTGFNTNMIKVILLYPLTESEQYDITVKGFKDFAGNEGQVKTVQMTYKADTSPIKASIEAIDQSYAVIKFNRPVTGLVKEQFYHTSPSNTALGIYNSPEMNGLVSSADELNRVWVKFYDASTLAGNAIADASQKISILNKYLSNEIQDSWGNKFAGEELQVNLNVDNNSPQVVAVRPFSESAVSVEFNEEVKFNTSNVEVLGLDGKAVVGTSLSVTGSGKKYTVNLGTNLLGKTILINIKNVEDSALVPNKMTLYTSSVNITDMTPPQVEKITKKIVPGLEQSLYIFFNEDVGEAALNAQNYSIQNPQNQIMTRLTETPSFYNGNRIVRLSLTNEQRALIDSGYNVFVSNVQDGTGNVLAGQIVLNSSIGSFDSSDNRPGVLSLVAVDKNTMAVTFNQKLTRVDEGVFILNGAVPASMNLTVNSEGNTVATLKAAVGHEFAGDLTGASLIILQDFSKKIENIFGLGAQDGAFTKTTQVKIEDRMAPSIKVISGKQMVKAIANSSGVIDAIVIEYEKDMDVTKLSALSYSVQGRAISRVYTNNTAAKGTSAVGRFVIIELKTDGVLANTLSRPVVTQVLDVYDMKDNKLTPNGGAIVPID
jgi:ribosomal protein S16